MSNCEVCGEAGATFPSIGTPGGFLCDDAVACLERFSFMNPIELYDEEEDYESD